MGCRPYKLAPTGSLEATPQQSCTALVVCGAEAGIPPHLGWPVFWVRLLIMKHDDAFWLEPAPCSHLSMQECHVMLSRCLTA